ncbi:MAG: thioredoxin family protein [Candidatus Cloacimonetes bacterium]|nr:thioredoxin family protein [Candidatus Cloacimonadota bacterium]MCF7814581.1 thioredoxin family protein [Candidatus Cloacimonadota bacterium]MCF7869094.1 thioredoxin family protein [Candidatus Cloacimonadota bacterium]MCF7884511.1 thioredoxin family protein [Candidatus Cloacimonadota bacterium]
MKKTAMIALMLIACLAIFAQAYVPEEITTAKITGNEIQVTFDIPAGMHITLQKDLNYIEVDPIADIEFEPTVYPEGKETEDGYIEYHGSVTLTKKFTVTDAFSGTPDITFYAGFQMCLDNGTCFMPEEFEFTLPFEMPETATETESQPLSDLIKFLIMAFFGGLILNVMPCVLPVLSIKAMSLVKQSQQDKKQIFRNSMAYTMGILTSFLILALVIVILKTSGELVGWGFQFQNTGFVIGLLILIFVFSLSMFDVFIIRAPGMTMATKASSKGGYSGSFFSGIFAVLLATPCTAPLLAPALGFAFSQPPVMIFAFFILIGLGLAFPFILLGIWPKAIKAIPKPGEWMNIFKEVMGFLLLLTALYLLRSLYFLIGGINLINVLFYLIILAFAVWIYGRFARPEFSRKKQWIATVIALIIAIGAGFLTLNFGDTEAVSEEGAHYPRDWQKFEPELVQQYRDEGKPVFVDFGAEWCLTCKTNEEAVLFTDEIEAAFKEHGVQMLRGDNTKKDDTISEWLTKFKRAGVPLYLFYIPDQEKPEVLPELITKDMIHKLLDRIE